MDKKRIVVVLSSSSYDRQFITTMLESQGYLVAAVPPGFNVPSYVCSARPEMLVYDIHDFWTDALKTIREVKTLSPETLIIGICEGANWHVFFSALDAGATDLLARPYTSRQILDAMALALGRVPA